MEQEKEGVGTYREFIMEKIFTYNKKDGYNACSVNGPSPSTPLRAVRLSSCTSLFYPGIALRHARKS